MAGFSFYAIAFAAFAFVTKVEKGFSVESSMALSLNCTGICTVTSTSSGGVRVMVCTSRAGVHQGYFTGAVLCNWCSV